MAKGNTKWLVFTTSSNWNNGEDIDDGEVFESEDRVKAYIADQIENGNADDASDFTIYKVNDDNRRWAVSERKVTLHTEEQ